jgi:hypothetical protein
MMTDHDERFRSEGPLEELASDVWGITKSLGTNTPAEELEAWRKAVRVLEGFCQVADGLMNEPLILALADAKVRADEEFERARDRAERPEGAELHPREEERLTRLLRRSDALNTACVELEDAQLADQMKADTLEVLRPLRDEANEAFARYRLEIGLED